MKFSRVSYNIFNRMISFLESSFKKNVFVDVKKIIKTNEVRIKFDKRLCILYKCLIFTFNVNFSIEILVKFNQLIQDFYIKLI